MSGENASKRAAVAQPNLRTQSVTRFVVSFFGISQARQDTHVVRRSSVISLPSFRKRQATLGEGRQTKGSTKEASNGTQSPNVTPHYDAAALEALVQRAERAVGALQSLESTADRGDQFAALEERISGLDRQIGAAELLTSLFESIREEATGLSASQERADEQIAAAGAELTRIGASLGDLGGKVESLLRLGAQLDHVEALSTQFTTMSGEAGAIRSQLRDMIENVARLRTVHDDVLRAHKHATIRLDGLDQRQEGAASKMDVLEGRAEAADKALEALLRLAGGMPDVEHQLAVLKTMADQIAQKTAALEQQRESVERAVSQASQVASLNSQLGNAVRGQEEQTRALKTIEGKLSDLQALHDAALARGAEISGHQQELGEAEREATRQLAHLREEMRASSERFELENRSLDAASERVAELRGSVTECEARLGALDAAGRAVAETEARSRSLASQVTQLAEDVSRISAQAERLRVVRDDVGELSDTLSELGQRVQRLQDARPMLDEVARDVSTLKGAQEAIRDGLEQVRTASSEMLRLRERQSETSARLADAEEPMRILRGHVEELQRATPSIDSLRADVERVHASITAIESRSDTVNELHSRLATMESTVAGLDERSISVRGRMDAAEARFGELSRQAAEAQRVATTLASVTAAVDGVERRMEVVGTSIDVLAEHAQRLDGVSERVRVLGQEIEQRQGALEKASEHLTRASDLRREAADSARQLEEITNAMAARLDAAESRATDLSQLAHDLEGRAASLGDVDRRMTQLEELLGRWEAAQVSVSQALEQIVGRQATVDAVHAQVKHVFEIAERTSADVHSIATSRRDIEGTRAVIDQMQDQLKRATEAMRDFAERKRQIEQLEQRLVRADALTKDVRSTVELIVAQRAVIDQALERSGSLSVQTKQAEGLIEALRAQCTLATKLQDAISELRDEDV
jgi:chromosome segregation ATPase